MRIQSLARPLYWAPLIIMVLGLFVIGYEFVLGDEPEGRNGPEIVEVIEGKQRAPLTEEQQSITLQIVLSDPDIKEILQDREYAIGEIVPWNSDGKLIGGGVHIRLAEPIWMERDWPVVEYDKSRYEFPHYREGTSTGGAVVANLFMRVDFARDKLVAIAPMP